MMVNYKRVHRGSSQGIITGITRYTCRRCLKSNRVFVRLHRSQKPVRFPVAQNESVHRATPSFFPPAAPSGITHYTFVPKVVCQRGLPPLWKPRRLCRKRVPTPAFRVATFPPNPQNKNGASCHRTPAAPLCFVLRLPLAAGAHLQMSADHSQVRFSIILF